MKNILVSVFILHLSTISPSFAEDSCAISNKPIFGKEQISDVTTVIEKCPKLIQTEDVENEAEVYQREYIVTSAQERSFVQTSGVYTCVALVIYSKSERKGLLAHIDSATNLQREIERFGREFDWNKVEVSVLGGRPGDPTKLFENVKKEVIRNGGKIKFTLQNQGNDDLSLRLNLQNGEISSFTQKYISTDPGIARAKVDRLKMGDRLFKHEESIGGGDKVIPLPQGNGGIHGLESFDRSNDNNEDNNDEDLFPFIDLNP